ncbi:aa3-type cytochrome c oxidase subunit IV [Azospirillum sp. SYSU D00513]|nr:aa3-type cytochrome c oxidase subunit IV [Azospirillum sp. SYSU D00513]
MAAMEQNRAPVSDEVVREHQAVWVSFTKFVKYGIYAVIAILVLMALFLL